MLVAYLSTLIIGGSLIVISLFGGGDHDADGDLDLDGDMDFESDFDADFDMWLPFASLRFWTFFTAFFGLVGTVLTFVGDLGTVGTLLPAVGVGYVCGVVATRVLRALAQQSVGKAVGANDLIGTVGVLMLPASPERAGKLRMQMGGRTIELIAETEGDTLKAGESAIVISVHDDGGVVVAPAKQLETSNEE